MWWKFNPRGKSNTEGIWDFGPGNRGEKLEIGERLDSSKLPRGPGLEPWTVCGMAQMHSPPHPGEVLREYLGDMEVVKTWWARKDLNLGPMDYESTALTAELRARHLRQV